MMHLTAWSQSVQIANVLQAITAVQDPVLATLGNDIRVPAAMPYLMGAAAVINDATLVRAQVQAPSLRAMINEDIEPVVQAKVLGSFNTPLIHRDAPIPLMANEALNFAMQSNGAGVNMHIGGVILADGPMQPVTGPMYSVRATAACALVASTWVNGILTFGQVLPYGTYQIVGMRARGANLFAARLVFPGSPWRPGVFGVSAIGGMENEYARFGRMGVFGIFDSTVPPTVDCLGDTDAAQTFIFDLIKIK